MEEKEKKKKESKKDQVLELTNLLKEKEEEVLKAKADLINYRKRKDEEMNTFVKYANANLIESLLPVLDNFERAVNIKNDNLSEELKTFLKGFEMIYVNMKEILTSLGVKEIDCLHKKFDSKLENCVFTEEDKNFEDEIVLDVISKGYTYNDKVLRCASVKVNKINNEKENE